MSSIPYSELEREVFLLKAVTDLIDDMVNYEIFMKFDRTNDMNLMFSTITHQRIFNVMLTDMLSLPQDDDFGLPAIPDGAIGSEKTFLYFLRLICKNPKLNSSGTCLTAPVKVFSEWLDAFAEVDKVWFPSIGLETSICVRRIDFIKICGDMAKHSFPRMSRIAHRIRRLLAENGHKISTEDAYLAFPDFYDWFHRDIFNYHSSAIGEFLNNIRWGIYDYLTPAFSSSFKAQPPPIKYKFDVPAVCKTQFGRDLYWQLMNWRTSEPYMPRFEVTRYLKMRY